MKYWFIVEKPIEKIFNKEIILSKGIMYSEGFVNSLDSLPEGETWSGPHTFINAKKPIEKLFEQTRQKHFPNIPSRLKNFFVLHDLEMAMRASKIWYPNEQIQIERCYFVEGTRHKADSIWHLNPDKEDHRKNALQYWRGKMTDDPIPEIIICGIVYFPDWKKLPTVRAS